MEKFLVQTIVCFKCKTYFGTIMLKKKNKRSVLSFVERTPINLFISFIFGQVCYVKEKSNCAAFSFANVRFVKKNVAKEEFLINSWFGHCWWNWQYVLFIVYVSLRFEAWVYLLEFKSSGMSSSFQCTLEIHSSRLL